MNRTQKEIDILFSFCSYNFFFFFFFFSFQNHTMYRVQTRIRIQPIAITTQTTHFNFLYFSFLINILCCARQQSSFSLFITFTSRFVRAHITWNSWTMLYTVQCRVYSVHSVLCICLYTNPQYKCRMNLRLNVCVRSVYVCWC